MAILLFLGQMISIFGFEPLVLFLIGLTVLLVILMFIVFLHSQILKKEYVELTEDYIRVKTLIKEKTFQWNHIKSVEFEVVRNLYGAGYFTLVRLNGIYLIDGIYESYDSMVISLFKYKNISGEILQRTIDELRASQPYDN